MSNPPKETIYIDAEDEITAIIEKVRESSAKVIALVLPKRSQTLQSVVNLKLLKRTAAESRKNIVLITSDTTVLPIAGAVGLHVAKTPQSKPEVPKTPIQKQAKSQEADEAITLDPSTPVGALAEDTIELDNEAKVTALHVPSKDASKSKKVFNKKLKVPDFNKFRLLLVVGGVLLVLLIVGSIFAFVVLPKATITIKTDTASIRTDLSLTAKTGIDQLDKENLIVPATKKELKKTENGKAPATGQKNNGEKAKGTMTLKNCSASVQPVTLPAGTPMSSNGLLFLTDEAIELPASTFNGLQQCTTATDTVGVTAQAAGDNFNLGSREYTVTGFSTVRATGSDMKGGTTKLVQVVSQSDIDTAKQKLLEKLNASATEELKAEFVTQDFQPLDDTYGAGEPAVTSTPNVNEEAGEVTVTITITYTELGVKKGDLKTLIEESVQKQIDTSKQSIQDNGLDKVTVRILDKKSATEVKFGIETISVAGPQLDAEGIKQEIAGKKKGATISAIEARPGIQEVEVEYGPFWVFSTPKRTNKINIIFNQSNE